MIACTALDQARCSDMRREILHVVGFNVDFYFIQQHYELQLCEPLTCEQ